VHLYLPTVAVKGELAELQARHGWYGLRWYETLLQTGSAQALAASSGFITRPHSAATGGKLRAHVDAVGGQAASQWSALRPALVQSPLAIS
jgi:hypothetical protein